MKLVLPPVGTRGVEIPKAVRPLVRAMSWTGRLMFRVGMKIQGRPLLRLITVGARSGKRRETVLGWFPDDHRPESFLIVASNAGSARHPGWAYNLAANPGQAKADLGEGEVAVDAELLPGEERASAWDMVVDLAPGYGSYIEKTDREIPIFRLTPRS
ncbi:MAG: nitroreductase/quinone reductase family protein [Acidimicrobiia bacterium]